MHLHALLLLSTLFPTLDKPQDFAELPLNDKVLEYCQKHLGKNVGNGSCAGLVLEALEVAGAKKCFDYQDNPGPGDYVWGELVYTIEANDGKLTDKLSEGLKPEPGDIIQLRNATFIGRLGNRPYRMAAEQHTAVLQSTNKDGSKWNVIQQSLNGKPRVSKGVYQLKDLKSGWLRVYRPEPK